MEGGGGAASFCGSQSGLGVSVDGGPEGAVSGIKIRAPWADRPLAEHRRDADATKDGRTRWGAGVVNK
jgi:hypothetical protein